MNVIFLDIDGVLNNVPSHSNRECMNRKWHLRIAPECLPPLEWLLQETGALIVMSSSLRNENFLMWTECLQDIGVPSAVCIGATPELQAHRGGFYQSCPRGHEIDAWLKDYCERVGPITGYVILDDDDDMEMHQAMLVQTNYHLGLTMEYAHRAAALLNKTESL